MSNELKDIVQRLNGYSDDGWEITQAAKHEDGSWTLTIQPLEEEKEAVPQEATDDNN